MRDHSYIPPDPTYTIDEFCASERISRVALYALWKNGDGPRFYANGRRKLITHRARLDWQTQQEAKAMPSS